MWKIILFLCCTFSLTTFATNKRLQFVEFETGDGIYGLRVLDRSQAKVLEYVPTVNATKANSLQAGAHLESAEEIVFADTLYIISKWNQGIHTKVLLIFNPKRSNQPVYSKASDRSIDYEILNDEIHISYNQGFNLDGDIDYVRKKEILKKVR